MNLLDRTLMLLLARKCFEKAAKERCSENAEFNAMIASWAVSSSYHSKESPKGCIKSIQFLRIMGTNYQNHRRFSGIANQKIIGKSTFFHKKCPFLGYLTEMLTSRDGGDGDGILKKPHMLRPEHPFTKNNRILLATLTNKTRKKHKSSHPRMLFLLLEQVFVKSQIFRLSFCWAKMIPKLPSIGEVSYKVQR